MSGRLKLAIAVTAAAAVLAPAHVTAQDGGRFVVLIPYFEPLQGSNDGFGKDASEELRKLINTLPTHEAMSRRDIEHAADDFNLDMEDVTCTAATAIQLASQLNVPVAVCATYTEDDQRNRTVNASIRTIDNGEEFVLDQFQVGRNDGDKEAAQQIFAQFSRFNDQVRATQFCGDYANSQQWDDALRQCDAALEINPEALSTRFLRAQILQRLEREEDALEEVDNVLEVDPFHEDALNLCGFLATRLGHEEQGTDCYTRYLDLNPGNVQIRMRIAYDQAQAGNPQGAMDFIQVGLDVDPDNADLNDQYANFAFAAAQNEQTAWQSTPGNEGLSPEAAGYYRQAIEAFMKVFAQKGSEMQEGRLRNILAAHIQLEEFDEAISKGEQFIAAHPQSDVLWSIQADALQRAGRIDDAIAALDQLESINPEYPNIGLRQGSWLIQAGRIQDAADKLAAYATQHPDQADASGRMIWNDAYQKGVQQDDYAYAIRGFTIAEGIPGLGPAMLAQIHFWHGYSLYSSNAPRAEAQTLETAQATLPGFQQALTLLQSPGVADYASSNNINLQQILEVTHQNIDIQQLIIDRGR